MDGGARPDGRARWRSLSHRGVALPQTYERLNEDIAGSNVLWDGKPVSGLSAECRFFASEFVRRGGVVVDLGRGRREARLFGSAVAAARFWADWKATLPSSGCPISSLADARLDLSRLAVVRRGKAGSDGEGEGEGKRENAEADISTATVDGKPQPVAPWAVDRPGIFYGRPGSALTGRLRRRITESDVTLNLGPGATAPPGKWAAIVRDPRVDWIARWRDPLTRVVKYARLSASSGGEQKAALERFDLARALGQRLRKFARLVAAAVGSHDRRRKQLGVCLWLMWRLALRAGSGSPEEAAEHKAHGAANLLAKHVVVLSTDAIGGGKKKAAAVVRLDFPGKDGVRYVRTLDPAASPADAPAIRALADLRRGKRDQDPIFDRIAATDAAAALAKTLPGATPKVLRTMRATEVFSSVLARVEADAKTKTLQIQQQKDNGSKLPGAVARAALIAAGAASAALCNHRKKVAGAGGKGEGGGGDLAAIECDLDSKVVRPLSRWRQLGDAQAAGMALGRKAAQLVRSNGLSLATARANYIDPRVVVAFARRHGVPTGYSKALSQRFAIFGTQTVRFVDP
jgi:DNA topoisomerase-1